MKTLDGILTEIGEFGPYQKRLYFFLCLPSMTLAGMLVVNVFILGVPDHRCKLPGYDNDTYDIQDDYHAHLINVTIPASEVKDQTYDQCHYWNRGDNSTTRESCSEWVYDTSVYTSTFAKTLNMVCDDAIMIPNAQMVFYFGVLAGSFFYGQLSDVVGRQKTMYLCVLVMLASSVGLVFIVEYIGFCILLFVIGGSTLGLYMTTYVMEDNVLLAASSEGLVFMVEYIGFCILLFVTSIGGSTLGLYMTTYVMGMELVGPSKRLWTGNIIQSFLTTGVMYLILMVYLIREWKYFTLAVALQGCLYLPYYWTIPESCRWLLSKGRTADAAKILQRVARSNRTTFNEKDLQELPPVSEGSRVWHLFSTRRLASWTLLIYVNWFVASMSYYGVVMYTGSLGGSLYLNFVLMTSVEYLSKGTCLLLMDRVGRKRLFIGFMVVGGAACVGTIWPIMEGNDKLHPVLIAFAMLGKMCVTGAFATVYVHSAELFPTVVRNAGMGSSSAIARVGSMIAPYIAKSADLVGGTKGKIIPLTLFGAAMFVSGLLTTLLPETLNAQLPETIDDVNNITRKNAPSADKYENSAPEGFINTGYTQYMQSDKM